MFLVTEYECHKLMDGPMDTDNGNIQEEITENGRFLHLFKSIGRSLQTVDHF